MDIKIIVIIIIIFVLLSCTWNNNNEHYSTCKGIPKDHEDYFIDDFDIESTPYSHESQYDHQFHEYRKRCNPHEPGSCLNGRCVYKSMDECQRKCKTGCRHCRAFGLYECQLQRI
jgi:FtsZ-interacting cell division protein ZipA